MNILNKIRPKTGLIVGGAVTLAIGLTAVLVTSKVALVALALFGLIGMVASVYFAVRVIKTKLHYKALFAKQKIQLKEPISNETRNKGIQEIEKIIKNKLLQYNEQTAESCSTWQIHARTVGGLLSDYQLFWKDFQAFDSLPKMIIKQIQEGREDLEYAKNNFLL